MKRLIALVGLALAVMLTQARAEGPEDQYVHIYNLIQQADSLNKSDQPAPALAKYVEAQNALQTFQKLFPDWNVKVVTFRLKYLAAMVTAVSAKVPAPVTPGVTPASSAPAGPTTPSPVSVRAEASADFARQMSTLQDEVRRLQADKIVLEAKLKEALATQPASVDPRELAKAQEKIQLLMKENDLLKVSLAPELAKPAPGTDVKAFEDTKQALADANRKLTEQIERANALAIEKKVLQSRLDSLAPSVENMGKLDLTQKALDNANRKLAEQNAMTDKLSLEKETLLARIQTLTTGVEAADALRAENQLLRKQVADLKSAAPPAGQMDELSRQLAQAQARIASMQSDAEILRLEKTALENRVRTFAARPAIPVVSAPVARAEDLQRIKLLEQERDDLLAKLNAANHELSRRQGAATEAKVGELQDQVSALRARLGVYESPAVPYSAQEIALFKTPETQLAKAEPKAGKKTAQQLPSGAATLVAEAERLFKARKYDQAEEKYLQILRQDVNNVYTLANLAAIQLEINRPDEAEKNVKLALAIAPDDAYALSILGYLRFKQERYEDALDALSRAAMLNPQSAEIQNYLGVTLSHKGMRLEAEKALRKAITLEPGYGSAHNNLAVIYATQQPPSIALARLEYQKAIAAGDPRNLELEKMLEEKGAPAGTP